ncbi:MAG: CheR family methyltransferase [Bacillota bacterium]
MEGYGKFKKNILRLTGLNLSFYKEKQMKRRIESLIKRNDYDSYSSYFKALKDDKDLFDEFINYLTINVSEFYRNPKQWNVLRNEILPKILKNNRNPKFWSAACSTGEEPYTLVMVLSEFMSLRKINVLAVDIDEEAINKAKNGIYSEKSLKNLPKKFHKKFFDKMGNSYKISDKIKKCVKFKKMNLLEDRYPSNNDLIICRNVMIYFTEEAKNKMYKKFSEALTSTGRLFVGSTEQIISPKKFDLESHNTFFYKKINK